jgi:hypothetical protein
VNRLARGHNSDTIVSRTKTTGRQEVGMLRQGFEP